MFLLRVCRWCLAQNNCRTCLFVVRSELKHFSSSRSLFSFIISALWLSWERVHCMVGQKDGEGKVGRPFRIWFFHSLLTFTLAFWSHGNTYKHELDQYCRYAVYRGSIGLICVKYRIWYHRSVLKVYGFMVTTHKQGLIYQGRLEKLTSPLVEDRTTPNGVIKFYFKIGRTSRGFVKLKYCS